MKKGLGKFLRAISHIVVGLTFILSGTLKLTDPVGTGLIVDEYLKWLHLDFLSSFQIWIGVALSTLEMVVGMAVLIGLQLKFFSWVTLALASFFTVITVLLVIFNPIHDCGCFGEAIHLTNRQTLLKNLVLLLLVCPIFAHRNSYRPIAPSALQWAMVGIFVFLGIAIAVQADTFNPIAEFTPYRVGTDLENMTEERVSERTFESTFIYEKDGLQKEFSLKDLPDSTWTFVDTRTVEISGSEGQNLFLVTDSEGEYVNEQIVSDPVAMVATVYDAAKMPRWRWERLEQVNQMLAANGLHLYTVSSSLPEDLPAGYDWLTSDFRTVIAFNRSNGGLTLLDHGMVVKKWPAAKISASEIEPIISQDLELTEIKEQIGDRAYLIALIAGLIVFAILFAYFSRLAFMKE